jgi:hypothetical protein
LLKPLTVRLSQGGVARRKALAGSFPNREREAMALRELSDRCDAERAVPLENDRRPPVSAGPSL